MSSNIEEMASFTKFQDNRLNMFLRLLLDELRDQNDRMARLEKQIAELLGKEEKDG
jgi:tRNA(Phe) wybutosine-synthesizing methylase Tyw3